MWVEGLLCMSQTAVTLASYAWINCLVGWVEGLCCCGVREW